MLVKKHLLDLSGDYLTRSRCDWIHYYSSWNNGFSSYII